MDDRYFALLVHEPKEEFESLKQVLHRLGVETYSVETRAEAEDLIPQCRPHVVFSDVSLPDGSWVGIQHAADALDVPLSVVVVARQPDTKLYVSVMQRGAFDFIVPPFEQEPVKLILRSAVFDTFRRREELARAQNVLRGLAPRAEIRPLTTSEIPQHPAPQPSRV